MIKMLGLFGRRVFLSGFGMITRGGRGEDGRDYVLEFLCCFALSDDGWEKTHELMVLYGDDEMVMPFSTHTHKCQQLSLQWSLSSSCSVVDPFSVFAIQERRKGFLCNSTTVGLGGLGVGPELIAIHCLSCHTCWCFVVAQQSGIMDPLRGRDVLAVV